MTCKKCDYFKPIGEVGTCRRFPPIQDGNGLNSVDAQPTVVPDGWCGEYKKNKGIRK